MPLESLHPKYRADIDGLRAIAVLSVVLFHAFPTVLAGGFIGVDIFFVISGFLISTIIFQNLQSESFSFTQFYARRIRRIFPALITVLIFCIAIGSFSLLSFEFETFGKHVLAGAGFVSNLVLWSESGYFDKASHLKPLLHLWSLGVEEQFYILWPLVLWCAARWNNRFLLVTSAIALLSFAVNLALTQSDPVAAFYSPIGRFWELLVGAFLAKYALHSTPQKSDIQANLLSLAGLSLIGLSLALLDKNAQFPGWWAVLPVVGAGLMIRAGETAWLNKTVLAHPCLVWIGLISYPIYLWHWPLLSFAEIISRQPLSMGYRLFCVALSIVLAWMTYRWVERPMRNHPHLTKHIWLLSVSIAIIGLAGWFIYYADGLPFRHPYLWLLN